MTETSQDLPVFDPSKPHNIVPRKPVLPAAEGSPEFSRGAAAICTQEDLAAAARLMRDTNIMHNIGTTMTKLASVPASETPINTTENGVAYRAIKFDKRDWFVDAKAPGINVNRNADEFYARIDGEGFRALPNIRIKVLPIIDFHLRDLDDGSDQWSLRVRQRMFARYTSRPKISIVNRGQKNSFLKFRLPSITRLDTISDVVELLATHAGDMSVVNVPIYSRIAAAQEITRDGFIDALRMRIANGDVGEAEVLMLFNDARYRRLRDWVSADRDELPPVTPSNVISILDELERRRDSRPMPTDAAAELEHLLEEAV